MSTVELERGQASMRIELTDSCITVWHAEDNVVLAILKDAPDGTWDKIWERLEELGLKRIYA